MAPFVKEPGAFIALGGIWAKNFFFEPLLKWLHHFISVGVFVGVGLSVSNFFLICTSELWLLVCVAMVVHVYVCTCVGSDC